MKTPIHIVIIGPSADYISGSLLRPINILYSLRSLKRTRISYIATRTIADLFAKLRQLCSADIAIVSGVSPWSTALVVLLRKLLRRKVVVDAHGFAWLEASALKTGNFLFRSLLLMSEKVAYSYCDKLIVASDWLGHTLKRYFRRIKRTYTIPNCVTPLFTFNVAMVDKLDKELLRNSILCKLESRGIDIKKINGKFIIMAPLPAVFKSNVEAEKTLTIFSKDLPERWIILVTGGKEITSFSSSQVIHVGYLSYPDYVMLLLASDAVILPYPDHAICGGIRNKVLEAGYVGVPIISTPIGVAHLPVKPWIEYVPLQEAKDGLSSTILKTCAQNLRRKVLRNYTFRIFRQKLTSLLSDVST